MENWRRLFRERFIIEENTKERYLRKYDHRTIAEELEHFIEQLEQEAERRGRVKENERCMKLIGEIIQATSWEAPQQFFDGLRCARSNIELKLLEEENGKQNAR